MRRPPVLALVLLVVAAAACSDDGGSDTSPTSPGSEAPGSTSSTTAPADATSDSPEPSDEEIGSEPAEPPDLDAVAVELTEIASGLDSPVAIASRAGDASLYVAEQSGRVVAIADGEAREDAVVDVSDEISTGNEQGLLGLAFSPSGRHLYVDFTDREGATNVVEWEFTDGSVIPESRRDVLVVEQPFSNHNGGDVRFGPDDLLYVSLGDGGAAGDPLGSGQDRSTLLGSILRIDPAPDGDAPYSVPGDNPFVDDADARGEIWQWGLRNPWRFSFDRATGDLWIGDVGQSSWEEVDFARSGEAGVNWGWSAREGAHEFDGGAPPDARDPIHEYPNPAEGVAVVGGFVYRGDAIPSLRGAYVYSDSAVGDVIAIVEEDGVAIDVQSLGVNGGVVTSFGEDNAGELYVTDRGGRVLRLDPA